MSMSRMVLVMEYSLDCDKTRQVLNPNNLTLAEKNVLLRKQKVCYRSLDYITSTEYLQLITNWIDIFAISLALRLTNAF